MKDTLVFLKGETIMALFRKGETYNIVVDKETNFWVQRFAENRSVKGQPIGVWNAGELIVVSFRTKETRDNISKQLKNTFKEICDVRVCDYLTFVTKRK